MKQFKTTVLILSGLALFYASSTRLINPSAAVFLQTFFENRENSLEITIDLVNEIRGMGAVLFIGGIIALFGTLRVGFRETAFVVTMVILGGVAIGRSLSFLVDGIPNQDLIRVALIEAVLAALNIVGLVLVMRKG